MTMKDGAIATFMKEGRIMGEIINSFITTLHLPY